MPDDQSPTDNFVIGVDPGVRDGMIVFVTQNWDGTVSHMQAAGVDGAGRAVCGRLLRPGDWPRLADLGADAVRVSLSTNSTHIGVGTVHIGPVGEPPPPDDVDLTTFDLGRFTDLGRTDSDGLTYARQTVTFAGSGDVDAAAARLMVGDEYLTVDQVLIAESAQARLDSARRVLAERLAAAPAPGGDVLDRIDAAVGELCACGCRIRIPADGASAYFATAACQRRWHSARATDAQDVYRRPDAATHNPNDAARVPLNEPEGHNPGGFIAAVTDPYGTHTRIVRAADPIPPCPDLLGAGYRVHCAPCGEHVVPQYVRGDDYEIMQFGSSTPVSYVRPPVQMVCPHCLQTLPGRTYIATVHEDGNTLILKLGLGDGAASMFRRLRLATLIALPADDRAALVARRWAQMERELDLFHRQWVGRTMAAEYAGMTVLRPGSTIRVAEV